VAARQRERPAEGQVEAVEAGIHFIELDEAIARAAGAAVPPSLRSLDAIHLASALSVSDELDALVTYDQRLADAARAAGLSVIQPR
jgi:predicted nucleic acid-binding protein